MRLMNYGRRISFVGLVGLVGLGCSENPEPNKGLENTTYSERSVGDIQVIKPVKSVSEDVKPDYKFKEDCTLEDIKTVLGERYINLTDKEKTTIERNFRDEEGLCFYPPFIVDIYSSPEAYSILAKDFKDFKVNDLSDERKGKYLEAYPWISKEDLKSMDNPSKPMPREKILIAFSEYFDRIGFPEIDFRPKKGDLIDAILTIEYLVGVVSEGFRDSYKKLKESNKK